MEYPWCKQRITKVSLAEILRCFEHPISEEQAWAICFQCCCKMEQLAQGLYPPLHSVFIKGPGSIFIHADGTASFKVYPKSDVGSIQLSEDKLLECLGVAIYEALDWGIDSQAERELSDHLEKLLCIMLKLDNEAMKPAATLQDVIKVCEEHLSRPSEATSYYKMTCGRLFTEYVELQKLVTIIQTSKESLRKMDVEDLVKNPCQKKEKNGASLWPSIIHELENGVRLRKATERSRCHVPPKESIRSPYEILLDDIQHKRYTLRKVIIKQNHSTLKDDVAAPKSHLKPVLERKLNECVPLGSSWHEHLMTDIKQQQKLQSAAARENGSRPKEMLVMPNTVLKSPSNTFLTLQSETTPKLPSSTWLASTGPSVVSCISKGIPADGTSLSVSTPTLGDTKHNGFLDAGQQQLPPSRGRSKSLERVLQSKELNCHFSTQWPSPTIAELIGTRYTMMVLEGQGLFQGGAFPRAKICFSCHKQMLLKWPYSCHLCSSVVCCDCCIKASLVFTRMSMPFRTCVHLPLHLLKLLRLSREEDPATQKQKSSELLHEIEHWEKFGVPVILEPRCQAQPLCCYTGTTAGWLTADICTQCERYLLEMASSQRQNIPLRRNSWPRTKLE